MATPVTKTITLFFYGEGEGAKAKQFAAAERKNHNTGMTRDAARFDGMPEKCDKVIIMPGAARHHANAIKAAYGDIVAGMEKAPVPAPVDVVPTKVHRGHGVWSIMLGDKELSGPHTRSEIDAELTRATAAHVGRNRMLV